MALGIMLAPWETSTQILLNLSTARASEGVKWAQRWEDSQVICKMFAVWQGIEKGCPHKNGQCKGTVGKSNSFSVTRWPMGPWRRQLVGPQGRPCGGGKSWPILGREGLQSRGMNQSELLHDLQGCPVDQKSLWGTIFEVALTQGLFCPHITLSDTSLNFFTFAAKSGSCWSHRFLWRKELETQAFASSFLKEQSTHMVVGWWGSKLASTHPTGGGWQRTQLKDWLVTTFEVFYQGSMIPKLQQQATQIKSAFDFGDGGSCLILLFFGKLLSSASDPVHWGQMWNRWALFLRMPLGWGTFQGCVEVDPKLQRTSEHLFIQLAFFTYMVTEPSALAFPQPWSLAVFQSWRKRCKTKSSTLKTVTCHMVAARVSPERLPAKGSGIVSDQGPSCSTRSWAGFALRPCLPWAAPFNSDDKPGWRHNYPPFINKETESCQGHSPGGAETGMKGTGPIFSLPSHDLLLQFLSALAIPNHSEVLECLTLGLYDFASKNNLRLCNAFAWKESYVCYRSACMNEFTNKWNVLSWKPGQSLLNSQPQHALFWDG